jgi:hypothetical protein
LIPGRTASLLLFLAVLAAAPPAAAAEAAEGLPPTEGWGLVRDLASDDGGIRRRAAGRLIEAGDRSLVPGLVDALFFIPRKNRGLALNVLEALTGEARGSRYLDWVEYVGSRTDLHPKEGYAGFKGALFSRIDARFGQLLHDGVPARIRLEEVVWGGVRFEGIPALDRPRHVPAAEAGYLLADELVFGVSAGGEHRAYPRRILSWHEMANDVLGGEPVTLSFCTLCNSAIAYSGRLVSGQTLTFGTSGLLYRSNKLMVDRSTGTLWSNLTGEAVVGPLAAEPPSDRPAEPPSDRPEPLDQPGPMLELLPVTLTTWAEWRSRHPETTALALEPERGRRWGFDYSPGAADRARAGVSFPVWRKSARLDSKAEVYTLRVGGAAKAYPLEVVLAEGVVHDRVGDAHLVLLADPESGAVRAYRRGGHSFRRAEDGGLVDEEGRPWRLTETALEPPAGAGLEPLPRLPGHVTFWFGWFGFFPETEVYGDPGT